MFKDETAILIAAAILAAAQDDRLSAPSNPAAKLKAVLKDLVAEKLIGPEWG